MTRHACVPPVPVGEVGDLWRCLCGRLWRFCYGCSLCNDYGVCGGGRRQPDSHTGGLTWRPATLGLRVQVYMMAKMRGRVVGRGIPAPVAGGEVTGERWEVQTRGLDRWHVVRARQSLEEARTAKAELAELRPAEKLRIRHIRSLAETVE